MTSPKQLKAQIQYSRVLAGPCLTLVMTPEERLAYKAGQYMSLKVNAEGERRSYSLASWPSQKDLELMVDTEPMGKGSRYALGLKPGDEVEILFPMGRFTIEDTVGHDAQRQLLFIGTGSGIVPLRSMIHSLLEEKNYQAPIRLHWGMRHMEDLYWVDELRQLEAKFPNFKLDIVLSQASPEWRGCRGHVNDCLVEHQKSWSGWAAYLCGNRSMIEQIAKLLVERGIDNNEIFHEQFY